jgi:pilus assembly protein CpaB
MVKAENYPAEIPTDGNIETGAFMNMKTVIPLGLAIVLGLFTAFLFRNLANRSAVAPINSNLVSVVVAKQDVDPGKSLDKDDLMVAKVPAELAPGRVFSDPNQLVGRVPITPLAKGQTIMETLLAQAGMGSGLQALIPPGFRAFTLEVNEFSGVAGMLEPGCRVDLICNINDPKTHESMSKTILQNVKITAIGRNVSPQHPVDGQPLPPPANNVTLLVTPKQAQTLELATMSSRPWLVLRSGRDNQELNIEPLPLSMLRGDTDTDPQAAQPTATAPVVPPNPFGVADEAPAPEPQPTTVRRTVTFIKNGVESQVSFMIPAPNNQPVDAKTDSSPIPGQP